MKVVLATYFPKDPSVPHGGVEAVSVNLAGALAKLADLDVHVVTHDRTIDSMKEETWDAVTVHRLPTPRGSTLRTALGAGRVGVQKYCRLLKPDVVHAHDTYGFMVQGLEIPRVFTVHGFIHGDTLVSGERLARIRSWIWRWFEHRAWADQPHVISISPYVRERLGGIARGVIHDIDNPVSEHFFHAPRSERRGVVFSAAVINPRKNTLALVEAFGLLRAQGIHAELRLAGPVVEKSYGQAVERRIRDLGLEGSVRLLGSVPASRIVKEMTEASVFALVSLEENSPMGIEEAMAVGVPVVTSNRCGMPYLVRSGRSGYLVNPFDSSEIAARIALLLGNDELRASMSEESRKIALDRFHPEVVAQRTREVYEMAAGSQSWNADWKLSRR